MLKEMAAAAGVNRDENRPDLPLRSIPIYPCSQVQMEEMVFMAVINGGGILNIVFVPNTFCEQLVCGGSSF